MPTADLLNTAHVGADEGCARLLYEVGMLKRLPRAGWGLVGLTSCESVADHVCRTAIVAFVLAVLDGRDPARAAALALFHDLAETRTGDRHLLARDCAPRPEPERHAWDAMLATLPRELARALAALRDEYAEQATPEAVLAHDADRLECLLQAREYAAVGATATDDFVVTALAALTTDVARAVAGTCLNTNPEDWWQHARHTR